MTEEERKAWDGVTEEAAMHIVEMVSAAAGETLLRGALRKLCGMEATDPKYRIALVYQALMAASDAGYKCGIRVQAYYDIEPSVVAILDLPTGTVAFPLAQYEGFIYTAHYTDQSDIVRRFLDAGENNNDGKASRTTGEQ